MNEPLELILCVAPRSEALTETLANSENIEGAIRKLMHINGERARGGVSMIMSRRVVPLALSSALLASTDARAQTQASAKPFWAITTQDAEATAA